MSNAAGGLSDALRQLSEGVQELPVDDEPTPELEAAQPTHQPAREPAASRSQAAAASAAAQRSTAASSRGRQPSAQRIASSGNLQVKQIAWPVLVVTGLLLMMPGVWGILVLADWEVIGYERDGARLIAVAMLLAWPLALFMFGGAAFFYCQVQQIKRDMKAASKSSRR